MTATAIGADEAGALARAQGLATEARSLSELAHSRLQSMSDKGREQAAWQALLMVYLGTAQAANSLLPAYSNTHGIAPRELAQARTALDEAHGDLPAMCFALPADVETPASS